VTLQQAKLKYFHSRTPENKSSYSTAAQSLSSLYISKKNLYYDDLSTKLMALSGDNQHTKAWRQIDIITGRKARAQHNINADSEEEKTQLWVSLFKQLLNPNPINSIPEKVVHPNAFPDKNLDYNVQLFTLVELKTAIKAMQDEKAAGVDDLVNDVLKLSELHPILLGIVMKLTSQSQYLRNGQFHYLYLSLRKVTHQILTTTEALLL
jgi:hypothetical protein